MSSHSLSRAIGFALVCLSLVSAPALAQSNSTASAPAPAAAAQPATTTANPKRGCAARSTKDSCAVDLSTTIVAPTASSSKESFKAARNAPIDCFYVYPTVSLDQTGNSDMTAGPEEHGVILQQFARFSSVCRVYAPLYRQVTLTALRSIIGGKADPHRPHARVQRRARRLELLSQERQRGSRRRARRSLAGLGRADAADPQRDRRQAGAGEDRLRAAARHEPAGREGQGRRRVPEHPALQVGVADRLRGRLRELPRQRSAASEFALRQGARRKHGRRHA